ncbi:MAG: thioredoxin domain-containing protein [Planctomycetota bacterium]
MRTKPSAREARRPIELSPVCIRVAVITVCAIVSASGISGCDTLFPIPSAPVPIILDSDHVLGNANAPVTVVEYSSFSCHWCGLFARDEFATLEARYVDTGQVRWVFRSLLSMGDSAQVLPACAVECAADQGRYFDYRERLFENRGDLSESALKEHATALGIERAAFDDCLDGESKIARVQQDVDSGFALGADSTPTFFIDGEMVRGYQTADEFGAVIDRHLAGL